MKFLILLSFLFCTLAHAVPSSKKKIEEKIFNKLERKYNFPREDFIRYTKDIDARSLFIYVVLAHEANQKVDDIISFAKNYKWPLDKKVEHIDIQIGVVITQAVVYSKESDYTFDEILKMTEYGNPKKIDELDKKFNIDRSILFKRMNDIRQELDLSYKDYK